MGRELARTLGFGYLDTGIMYRAITWLALKNGIPVNDPDSLGELARANPLEMLGEDSDRVSVGGHTLGPELRDSSVDGNVSAVSMASPVRKELVAQQRQTATKGKIVMIGRDIGTEVLPDADLKVFLTASPENRAQRRWQEMRDRGEEVELFTVLSETLARDKTDKAQHFDAIEARCAIVHADPNAAVLGSEGARRLQHQPPVDVEPARTALVDDDDLERLAGFDLRVRVDRIAPGLQ